MGRFEKVSRFSDIDINLPRRKTTGSAGYDFEVAEDIIIPSALELWDKLTSLPNFDVEKTYTLDEIATFVKKAEAKFTLIPTGIKCKLDPGTYLNLAIRSSAPLKYWLILANGVGIIDADYYNNPDNEGEIFFQVINLGPTNIKLQKGDIIGQGIIMPYLLTEDDDANGERVGGFGSTNG